MPEPDHQPHGHGHQHDRGWRPVLRYVRLAPKLWSSSINRIVVDELHIEPNERVLDVGAGMGAGTVLAARLGAHVIAVEPTPFLRAALRIRRLGQRARARIDVIDGAAEAIPVADASIDAVWAVNVMHHWTDAERATRELARVLDVGGRVLLVDEDFDDPTHPAHEEFSARHRHRALHFDRVDPAVVGEQLVGLGFVVHEAATNTLGGTPARVVRADRT